MHLSVSVSLMNRNGRSTTTTATHTHTHRHSRKQQEIEPETLLRLACNIWSNILAERKWQVAQLGSRHGTSIYEFLWYRRMAGVCVCESMRDCRSVTRIWWLVSGNDRIIFPVCDSAQCHLCVCARILFLFSFC